MELALLLDIGSTYTKGTVVRLDDLKLEARAKALTTVESDVNEGIENVLAELEKKGINLDDINHRLACSSAAGGLKMVAIGLVPDLTSEAAKRAALGAGAKVADVYSYELSAVEVEEITAQSPDVILLAGGTDGGNKDIILQNAKKIAASDLSAPIIAAGNKVAAREVEEILKQAEKSVYVTQNVMPELEKLNIEPAREKIREIFLNQIIYAKGLAQAREKIEGIIMPTPSAVMKAAELIAEGSGEEEGLGELVVVDIGGATTDVHSAASGEPTKSGVNMRGLEEPYVKRTVEGDLGMRYSASSLLEAAGEQEMISYLPGGETKEGLINYINKVKEDIRHIPESKKEEQLDTALAKAAVKLAIKRHVGNIKTVYSPFGESYVQRGKDLTELELMIGTGGVIVNSLNPAEILEEGFFSEDEPTCLAPKGSNLMVDSDYILAAVGLLAEVYPTKAFKLAKRHLKEVG